MTSFVSEFGIVKVISEQLLPGTSKMKWYEWPLSETSIFGAQESPSALFMTIQPANRIVFAAECYQKSPSKVEWIPFSSDSMEFRKPLSDVGSLDHKCIVQGDPG